MNNPFNIEKVVLEILTTNVESRSDDMKLYLLVCEMINPYPTYNRSIRELSFETIMNHYRELNLPHFESVRRARQKLQASHPELAGNKACRHRRKELVEVYHAYAKK